MIPIGYRPIRIASNKPAMPRYALVAWLIACFVLYCIAGFYYPSL